MLGIFLVKIKGDSMTREEALELYGDLGYVECPDVRGVVDDIYDDFEKRTCENCKHYKYLSKENGGTTRNMSYYICSNDNDLVPDADGGWLSPDKNFGCNQWETKFK